MVENWPELRPVEAIPLFAQLFVGFERLVDPKFRKNRKKLGENIEPLGNFEKSSPKKRMDSV